MNTLFHLSLELRKLFNSICKESNPLSLPLTIPFLALTALLDPTLHGLRNLRTPGTKEVLGVEVAVVVVPVQLLGFWGEEATLESVEVLVTHRDTLVQRSVQWSEIAGFVSRADFELTRESVNAHDRRAFEGHVVAHSSVDVPAGGGEGDELLCKERVIGT